MILIIDANNLAFRADQTTNLTTKQGKRVGAIFGTLKMIKSYITPSNGKFKNTILHAAKVEKFINEDESFNRVVCAWDGGKSAFRKALYPEYKAQREKKRLLQTKEEKIQFEAFKQQMKDIEYILPLLGVHSIKVFHFEADDIIYYLSKEIVRNKCIIVSTDKDMLQLVDDRVAVWSPYKMMLYTSLNFKRKVGLKKSSFIDYRVLVGDSSDNIKGIKGIGDKTAKQLISQYGSIDQMLKDKSYLMKKVRTARIFDHEDQLKLNKQLMDMNHIPIDQSVVSEVKTEMDRQLSFNSKEVKKFFYIHQFSSILSNFLQWSIPFRHLN